MHWATLFLLSFAADVSHPPLRTALPVANRPRPAGPQRFVDAARGNDQNAGSEQAPWKTLSHSLAQLQAGDTLYLRGGTYYEAVRVSLSGRSDAPITIRAHPGERAVVDGGFREFFESPQTAWQPYADGGKDEYRSTRSYGNLRHVMGSFGDSMIGLNAYYHARDLRADNELWQPDGDPQQPNVDVKPVYCGPGIWHDPATGFIHARLAHTHLPQMPNYTGPTDLRKVPLVLADFRSVPLLLDGAKHLVVQDLVIRGAGHDAVLIDNSSDVRLEGLTVWAGGYGLKGIGARRLKIDHCAFYGNVPPWTFRSDTSLRTYPDRGQRDITRLNTHALLVADAGREFDIYAFPRNDEWEISHCEFADGHDGVYLGGMNMRFHHNRVHHTQDDGIYLSPMYPRYAKQRAQIHLYQNYVGSCLTALAFGGPETTNTDEVCFFRNLVELRTPIPTGRPREKDAAPTFSFGKVIGDHGSPPWSAMKVYHNTFVAEERSRTSDMVLTAGAHAERPKYVFNNILLHRGGLPPHLALNSPFGQQDGNLYWGPLGSHSPGSYFDRYRKSPAFQQSKEVYPDGFESHSLVADPQLAAVSEDPARPSDYSLRDGSPAIDSGVKIPGDWPDPLRGHDRGAPDLGCLPLGAKMFATGP
jgi:hypothetical protein